MSGKSGSLQPIALRQGVTTLDVQVSALNRKRGHIQWFGLGCALLAGCQGRGYTDVYVDAMAAEIRDLEDQLYEYDHEYRLLEQELDSLRRENMSLQHSLSTPSSVAPKSSTPLDFLPRESEPANGSERTSPQKVQPAPRITPVPKSGPASIPPAQSQAIPTPTPSPGGSPNSSNSLPAPPELRSPGGATEEIPQPFREQPSLPDLQPPAEEIEFDAGQELTIPTITTGSVQPPSGLRNADALSPDDLEVNLSQIELPAQLAAAHGQLGKATIKPATQVVADKRIVELAFHPSMSRSINFNDDDIDDGLFLVLQPKNEQGQVVPVTAVLTVEVIDPARDQSQSRIGVWKYSAAEVEEKLQPMGSQQGIHLTLPWNGPNPRADRVLVLVTYTFDNGRQVIGQKEIYVNSASTMKTVWTPRASRSSAEFSQAQQLQGNLSPILSAGATSQQTESRSVIHATGAFPPPDGAPLP